MQIRTPEELRSAILGLVDQYARVANSAKPFQPGVTAIPASGKVIGSPELGNLVDAALDGWLTTGRFNDAFERRMASQLGVKKVLTTKSGS
jgi:CDP-6-deoxy-D-xylo-4-hexulose-3-dehydrase